MIVVCVHVCVLESQTTAILMLSFARTPQQPPVIASVVNCLEHVVMLKLTLRGILLWR